MKKSEAYSKLVSGETDVRGMVAYTIYKQQKIQYLENHEKESGNQPSQEKIEAFCESAVTEVAINNYYTQAEKLLHVYGENLVNNKLSQISNFYQESKSKSFFWNGVWQSVVGAVFFAIVLVIFGLIIAQNQNGGLKGVLQSVVDSL